MVDANPAEQPQPADSPDVACNLISANMPNPKGRFATAAREVRGHVMAAWTQRIAVHLEHRHLYHL
jgi:hypothetical protein